MIRKIFFICLLATLGLGSWYVWQHSGNLGQVAQGYLPSSEFRTLEIRHSADEIMQAHKSEFLKNQGYVFLEPKLLFWPYLLMEVKYSKGNRATGEGELLWGLNDGEMVIHTATWEKTHGFEDCLAARADKNDFKILEALAEHGGSMEREKIYNLFNVDQEIIDGWLESCRTKKLIACSGNKFRLHLEKPLLKTEPITTVDQSLVMQPAKNVQKMRATYSENQIKNLAQIAFGQEFAIRRCQHVYLPVHSISVQNPDGSTLTTYWNALNGKKLEGFNRK
jgi:hypothetical protein